MNSYSQNEASDEFYVPSTRNQTMTAMKRLFRFFSESNQIASSTGGARSKENFRLGFLADAQTEHLRAFIFLVNMNVTFDKFTVQNEYYEKLNNYFQTRLEQLKLSEGSNAEVYEQVKHG